MNEAIPNTTQQAPREQIKHIPLKLAEWVEPLIDLRIVIHKNDRTLTVYSDEQPIAQWKVGLGFAPTGHKQKEGDGRTPVGTYRVCVKNPNSRFHLSLGLSYPNTQDAAAALADGRISRATHDRITAADRAKKQPPWNTSLGGEIFIHGQGSSRDWTHGCIALDNDTMTKLFNAIEVGAIVEIKP